MDWLKAFDRPIAFHPVFVELTGSLTAALMLSQAVYWSRRTSDENGWFYKTREEWTTETALSRTEQENARKALCKTGFWHEERRGVPAQMYYRIDAVELESSLQANCQQDGGKPAIWMAGNLPSSRARPSLGSENTTESTQGDAPASEGNQASDTVSVREAPARSKVVAARAERPRDLNYQAKKKVSAPPLPSYLDEEYEPSEAALTEVRRVCPTIAGDVPRVISMWRGSRLSAGKQSVNWDADFVTYCCNVETSALKEKQAEGSGPGGYWEPETDPRPRVDNTNLSRCVRCQRIVFKAFSVPHPDRALGVIIPNQFVCVKCLNAEERKDFPTERLATAEELSESTIAKLKADHQVALAAWKERHST